MIPLHKLAKLPRSQKLRKAANLFGKAEYRFNVLGLFPPEEAEYLAALAELLSKDEGFSPEAAGALKAAQAGIGSAGMEADGKDIRRNLNSVYQLLLAETGRYQADWDFVGSTGVLDASTRRPFPGMQAYLEDIRSPFNVGSMFRAAESFGAEKLWLSPLCADPRHKRAERTAMGCVDILPWERFSHNPFAARTDAGFKREGFKEQRSMEQGFKEPPDPGIPFFSGPFFALETGGTPLEDFRFPLRGTLIAGSEELGVSPAALAAADASLGKVTIPTWGAKGSLNVSVAFGIVMQAWAASIAKSQFN